MVDTQRLSSEPGLPKGVEGSLQVGVTLQNRWRIEGVLGVGGMGSVYLTRDMSFPAVKKMVAVKEMMNIHTDPEQREKMRTDFERESNILADLNHPAIPKIFEYFTTKDRAYLVMEYINGKDLEAIVNATASFLPTDLVRKWAIQLCEVLDYLHSHKPEPIIFRDMKPSNVMIDSQGNVRLIDFGIARTFDTGEKHTNVGTEGYAPPEQYRGEASPPGDIYALGATLHQILTRADPRIEPPFTFAERPVRSINAKVPEPLERIVMRATEYHKASRWQTAMAMKEALEKMVLPPPVSANGAATASMPYSPGGAPTNGNLNQTVHYQSTPSGNLVVATPAVSDAFDEANAIKPIWKFQCEDEIRSTPVHYKGMVYVGAYDNNLYALNAVDGSFKWKFAADGGIVSTPGISPDDNSIIFGSEDNSLYAVDLRTGKVNWSFQTGGKIRGSILISSGHAFFGSDDAKLYAVRLVNGRVAWTAEASAPIRSRPLIIKERVIVGCESGEVLGYDLTGARKWSIRTRRAVSSSPVAGDDFVFFGSMDNQVYAIDPEHGFAAWRARTDKSIVGSPVIEGKMLYIGSADQRMYALDVTANGRELWRYETGGQIVSTPVLAGGAIYFGSGDNKVYSLDQKKGKLRWTFMTGAPITSSPCVVDRTVIIGSTDQYVYALNL